MIDDKSCEPGSDGEYFFAVAMRHVERVQGYLADIRHALRQRGMEHDASKFREPEFSAYAAGLPALRSCEYDSPEYNRLREEMAPTMDHHYAANRHHPEHWNAPHHGLAGMSLIDICEMMADWKAASGGKNGEGFEGVLEKQKMRFGILEPLYSILVNTAKDLEW